MLWGVCYRLFYSTFIYAAVFLRCCTSIHINNNFAKIPLHRSFSFHFSQNSRNCVMHGETMQFRRAYVCSLKTLLYENINLPHSNLICSRHYWTLLFEINDSLKVSEHMLLHFEWSLSYILQIILFFPFCPTSRPINTWKLVWTAFIVFVSSFN